MPVSGGLIECWNGPINFAAGLTWREQDFTDEALPIEIDVLGPPLNAPDIGIRGIPPGFTGGSASLHQFSTVPNVSGAYDVWEWFAEINVPFDVFGQVGTPKLTYGIDNYSVQLQQRYIERTVINQRWVKGRDVDSNGITSDNTTNLQLGYNDEMQNGGNWRLAFNVTNLFDRNPPRIASYGTRGGAQNISNNYDVFGRRYQISLNMDF